MTPTRPAGQQPIGGVELAELAPFRQQASDPNQIDASLYEFVGVPDYVDPVCRVDETAPPLHSTTQSWAPVAHQTTTPEIDVDRSPSAKRGANWNCRGHFKLTLRGSAA